MSTAVTGIGLSDTSVWLSHASPETTNEKEKVTSSTDWSLNGEASANGKCELGLDGKGKCDAGGGVKFNAGVRQSFSRSFDISDMSLKNISSGNQASWSFDIASPYWKPGWFYLGCVGFDGIKELKKLSAGTFQPTLQWFWKVGKDVRSRNPNGLPVTVQFSTRTRHLWHWALACPDVIGGSSQRLLFDVVDASGELNSSMLVPWPTILK